MSAKELKKQQEKDKYRFILFIFTTLAIFSPISGYLKGESVDNFEVYARQAVITASPTSTPKTEAGIRGGSEDIKLLIQEVFGEHSDKALLLLQGDGCSENKTLNPDALNDNTKWGGVGKDWGVFQINDHWQGIRHQGKAKQFLLDPEINVRIAWRLYEDSGYSFKLWTCGRYHGI